jgi:fibro-slime domain-containing protein
VVQGRKTKKKILTLQSDPSFNIKFPISLTLSNQLTGDPKVYTYSEPLFFPIDGRGFGNSYNQSGTPRNFAFTYNYNGFFPYRGDEFLQFIGDDDFFLYINTRLAINVGGVHPSISASINLTWPIGGCNETSYPEVDCASTELPCACVLGLSQPLNQTYNIDLFYNERHTTASTIQITTSIDFQCAYYDWCGNCEGDGKSCW